MSLTKARLTGGSFLWCKYSISAFQAEGLLEAGV